jgi:predicted branched-subunit amino acid permease
VSGPRAAQFKDGFVTGLGTALAFAAVAVAVGAIARATGLRVGGGAG